MPKKDQHKDLIAVRRRFDARTVPEPNSGCLLWLGRTDSKGYGILDVGDKGIRAHRLSWLWSGREIPGVLHILHACDVRACVNVDHLFLGDDQLNAMDRARKDRSRKGRLPFGVRKRGTTYVAQVSIPETGRQQPLGSFRTIEEAAAVAAAEKARRLRAWYEARQ